MAVKLCTVLVLASLLCAAVVKGNKEDRDYRDVYEYGGDEVGDDDTDDEKCPEIYLPRGLSGRCKISDFCSNITCEIKVIHKRATIIFKVNRCDDPITATVTVKIPNLDWSHTFKDGEKINLPTDQGVGKEWSPVAKVSASLLVLLRREGKKLHFKLQLLGKAEVPVYHKLDSPIDKTLIDGKMSLSNKHCGFSAWFNKQPRYVKILIIAGPILVFIFLLMLTAYCCVRRRRRAPARLHVQLPSHRVQATSTRSKVPMQRLINEE